MWVLIALIVFGITFILPIASWLSIQRLRGRVSDLESLTEDQARSIELLKRLPRPAAPVAATAAPAAATATPAAPLRATPTPPAPPSATATPPPAATPVIPKVAPTPVVSETVSPRPPVE